jgi:hypothetical protein
MKTALFFGALFLSAAASAQAPNARHAGSDERYDPNQTICRNLANTGSRLSRTRVCMTRAQWEDYRRATRQALEQTQSNRRATGGQ